MGQYLGSCSPSCSYSNKYFSVNLRKTFKLWNMTWLFSTLKPRMCLWVPSKYHTEHVFLGEKNKNHRLHSLQVLPSLHQTGLKQVCAPAGLRPRQTLYMGKHKSVRFVQGLNTLKYLDPYYSFVQGETSKTFSLFFFWLVPAFLQRASFECPGKEPANMCLPLRKPVFLHGEGVELWSRSIFHNIAG